MLRITTIDLEKDNDLHLCTVLYSVNRFDEERSVTLVVNLSFDFNTRVPSSPIKKEESRGERNKLDSFSISCQPSWLPLFQVDYRTIQDNYPSHYTHGGIAMMDDIA
jgi:hypothetical protein